MDQRGGATGDRYEELRPRRLVELRTAKPVAYLALGILEWHGLHNPLGLDGVKANAVLEYIAGKIGGVVMPPLFWGDDRSAIAEVVFDQKVSSWLPPGTGDHATRISALMGLSRSRLEEEAARSRRSGGTRLWEELVVHTLFEIESLGFLTVVPYPGHYPLIEPLDRAIGRYKAAGGTCDIAVLKDQDAGVGDHAARVETSLLLRLRPDLVDLGELDPADAMHTGVLGEDPLKHASAEYGEEILQKLLEVCRARLASVGAGEEP
jgi:creatinine amidohydrolase